jgi:hypothetical protein
MIRAKVVCVGVRKYRGWGATPAPMFYEAEFVPVAGGSPENDEFFASTPSGQLKLSTIRENHFTHGKLYYLDFTEAQE